MRDLTKKALGFPCYAVVTLHDDPDSLNHASLNLEQSESSIPSAFMNHIPEDMLKYVFTYSNDTADSLALTVCLLSRSV